MPISKNSHNVNAKKDMDRIKHVGKANMYVRTVVKNNKQVQHWSSSVAELEAIQV
jgi:hypothetical protein